MSRIARADVIAEVQGYVRYLRHLGVTELPVTLAPATGAAVAAVQTMPSASAAPAPPVPLEAVSAVQLAQLAADCAQLSELSPAHGAYAGSLRRRGPDCRPGVRGGSARA